MTREHNIDPCVAAYALFSTDFVSIDAAMDFIFERSQEGNESNFKVGKMQHIFIPYVPESHDEDEKEEGKELDSVPNQRAAALG